MKDMAGSNLSGSYRSTGRNAAYNAMGYGTGYGTGYGMTYGTSYGTGYNAGYGVGGYGKQSATATGIFAAADAASRGGSFTDVATAGLVGGLTVNANNNSKVAAGITAVDTFAKGGNVTQSLLTGAGAYANISGNPGTAAIVGGINALNQGANVGTVASTLGATYLTNYAVMNLTREQQLLGLALASKFNFPGLSMVANLQNMATQMAMQAANNAVSKATGGLLDANGAANLATAIQQNPGAVASSVATTVANQQISKATKGNITSIDQATNLADAVQKNPKGVATGVATTVATTAVANAAQKHPTTALVAATTVNAFTK